MPTWGYPLYLGSAGTLGNRLTLAGQRSTPPPNTHTAHIPPAPQLFDLVRTPPSPNCACEALPAFRNRYIYITIKFKFISDIQGAVEFND